MVQRQLQKVPKLARTYRFLRSPDLSCYGDLLVAAYSLKVITGHIGKGGYGPEHVPYHIARLFIAPALAAFVYFVLETGSFFGLSFDVTKVSIPLLPYLYACSGIHYRIFYTFNYRYSVQHSKQYI